MPGIASDSPPASDDPAGGKYQPPPPEKGLAKAISNTIALESREIKLRGINYLETDQFPTGILVRELCRQAVLIAARDQLGLSTRDATLREEIALVEAPRSFPVNVTVEIGKDRKLTIEVSGFDKQGHRVQFTAPAVDMPESNSLLRLVERLEPLTRAEFADLFKKLGYQGTGNRQVAAGALAEPVERLLENMDFISQFAAIRALHAAIRDEGESPQRLAALARAYANLGTVTEFHWSPAHKAFMARAMLYAERLVAREEHSASALRSRAYVRALVGLHQAALDDLDEAGQAVGKPAAQAPPWAEAIRAFCVYEPERLAAAREQPGNAQLVPYLNLLAHELSHDDNMLLNVSGSLLEANGDCDRAVDLMSSMSPLGVRRLTSSQSLHWFARRLYPRLAEVPDLPAGVKSLVAARATGENANADADQEPRALAGEIESRLDLLRALHAAGSAEVGGTEPSWQVLEQLIREVSFVLVWRAVDFEATMLGVPVDPTLDTLRPLVAGHPYQLFMESFVSDPRQRVTITQELQKTIDDAQFELTEAPIDGRILAFLGSSVKQPTLGLMAIRHLDAVPRDLARLAAMSGIGAGPLLAAPALEKISPHQPTTVVALMQQGWTKAAEQAPEWERRFADDPDVLRAIALLYQNLERLEDTERCVARLVVVSPTHFAYRFLANVQKQQDKLDEWRKNLERALELPAMGLEHAAIHVELADHLMHRLEWDQALPHALEAASSGAEWAMRSAGYCYEGLQDWESSESFFRAMVDRYEGAASAWFLWCHRTGHGNLGAARQRAEEYLLPLQETPAGDAKIQMGVFHALNDEPQKALASFTSDWEERYDKSAAYHLLLVAEELGKAEQRDALFPYLESGDTEFVQRGWQTRLGPMLLVFLKTPAAGWDSRRFEDMLLETEPGDVTNIYYYAGRFLELRGETEFSRRYLQAAATSPVRQKFTCALANHVLRKLNVAVESTRGTELEKDREKLADAVRKGTFERLRGLDDRAIVAYTKAIEMEPDCRPAILGRAKSQEKREKYDDALADCDMLLAKSPHDVPARKVRIRLFQKKQDYAAVIAEYQAVLADEPGWADGQRDLAWLLATCPDAKLRNAAQAIECAERARKLAIQPSWKDEVTLAAAYAESGDFTKAAERASQALGLRPSAEDAQEIQRQVKLYQQQKKYEPPPRPGK